MKRRLAWFALLAIAAGATRAGSQTPANPISLAAPDSFGLGDQILHIPAAAFQSRGNATAYEFAADGYLYNTGAGDYFVAPLVLPSGAEMWAICTYFYDTESDYSVKTWLQRVKLADPPVTPGVEDKYGPLVVPLFVDGYGVACGSLSYTYRNAVDVSGAGFLQHIVHQLTVGLFGSTALGGVRVFWRHQVGSHHGPNSFADVPTSDPAYKYVEALSDAAVTARCAPGTYCPNGPWTRRQMAVFLTRALGLRWPY